LPYRRGPHPENRLGPSDGTVEVITDSWDQDVSFVLTPDSAAIAMHAADLRLIDPNRDQRHTPGRVWTPSMGLQLDRSQAYGHTSVRFGTTSARDRHVLV